MFDIKWIRENPEYFDYSLTRRGFPCIARQILSLDQKRRKAQTHTQILQNQRNQLAKEVSIARSSGRDISDLVQQGLSIRRAQVKVEEYTAKLTEELEGSNGLLLTLPNLPAPDVPDGHNESANIELRRVGCQPTFSFQPKEHEVIGTTLGLMDFKRAAKISGSRFVVLKGALACLERAIATFMLDLHTHTFGYVEINPPALVRGKALLGTGQLPKFASDLFHTDNDYWLIPTAEVPLTNLVSDEILDELELPLRYTASTWCFRSEAGSAGRDTHGITRQHQFMKVELVSIVHPAQSDIEHTRMTSCAEEVLQRLELPYRIVVLCAKEMGFSACKTYDIEVWLPGKGRYLEVSSCSNCGDFQSRRMMTRFRSINDGSIHYAHTLNGSGLAVGRTLIAVIENYQQENCAITVPKVLRPYMGGKEVILP